MPETRRNVRPVEVNYICDSCGNGLMEQCGSIDNSNGEIPHRCVICSAEQQFKWRPYPRIDYVDADENA